MLSIGIPEPLGIRVWSTMNSPSPFAFFMMAGLLTLIDRAGILNISASVFGYLAFLLSQVRTAWLGWFGALIILFSSLKSKYQIRLIIIFTIMALVVVPLTTIEQFSDNIDSRFETLSNLEADGSGQARLGIYDRFFSNLLIAFIGIGLGNREITAELELGDSGIISIFLFLGWFGGSVYFSGMLKLIFELWLFSRRSLDLFVNICSSIAISTLLMMPLAGSHADVHGICLWGFLGIGLAGKKYYQNQRAIQIKQN
jgi:hypothetical protein